MYDENGKIKDRREMLRVKVKSLAAEAKIIRREEKRMRGGALRDELALHRRGVVRSEARHTHLAYGFIRGRTLQQIEGRTEWPAFVSRERVQAMLKKYGPAGLAEPAEMRKAA